MRPICSVQPLIFRQDRRKRSACRIWEPPATACLSNPSRTGLQRLPLHRSHANIPALRSPCRDHPNSSGGGAQQPLGFHLQDNAVATEEAANMSGSCCHPVFQSRTELLRSCRGHTRLPTASTRTASTRSSRRFWCSYQGPYHHQPLPVLLRSDPSGWTGHRERRVHRLEARGHRIDERDVVARATRRPS